MSVLSPYVIEQLLALRNQFGIFGMIVKQNGMQVAVNTNYTLFTRPFSFYDISQISTDNVKNELNSFITIIESFENAICYR